MEKFKFFKELIKALYEIRNVIKGNNNEGVGDVNKVTPFAINDAPVGVISSFDFVNIDDVFIPIDEFAENLQDYLNQTVGTSEVPKYKVYTFVYDKEPKINNFCYITKTSFGSQVGIGEDNYISELIKGTNLYYIYLPHI